MLVYLSHHLLGARMVLNSVHLLSHLILTAKLRGQDFIIHILRWDRWESASISNLANFARLVSARAGNGMKPRKI